jgi:hypothetical protein
MFNVENHLCLDGASMVISENMKEKRTKFVHHRLLNKLDVCR